MPLFPGVNFADIGRIASKHVKVTVSHKGSTSPSRDRRGSPKSQENNMMQNHVKEEEAKETNKNFNNEVEEMDTREGDYIYRSRLESSL